MAEVRLDDLPQWLPTWCVERLGGEPVELLLQLQQISTVFALRLSNGHDVVVKARAREGRAASCVSAQAQLAQRGFPCARPLTPAVEVGPLVVHAEEFRPGGEKLLGDSPEVASIYAEVFASLMAGLAEVSVQPPLPSPQWVGWDHEGPGLWPAVPVLDDLDQGLVPEHVTATASRVRRRLSAPDLPCALGHADFEAQNLRWHGRKIWIVHDWDSLAWQPEAALVGAASAAFVTDQVPTLASVESSAAFLRTYQAARGRTFAAEELEVAWAASMWTAAHNARGEALHGRAQVSGHALRAQAAERLRLARA